MAAARSEGVGCCFIGWTGGDSIAVAFDCQSCESEVSLEALREANERFFREWMEA